MTDATGAPAWSGCGERVVGADAAAVWNSTTFRPGLFTCFRIFLKVRPASPDTPSGVRSIWSCVGMAAGASPEARAAAALTAGESVTVRAGAVAALAEG